MIKMNLGELLGAVIVGSSWFQLWQLYSSLEHFLGLLLVDYTVGCDNNHLSGKNILIMN